MGFHALSMATLLAIAVGAQADDRWTLGTPHPKSGDTIQQVSSQSANLEERISVLEKALADAGKKKADAEKKPIWTDTSEQKFNVQVGGRAQGDWVHFSNQNAESLTAFGDQQDYFEFRRLRLFAKGKGYGVFDYKVELDFEPEAAGTDSAIAMKDVYIGIHEVPLLQYVRFGNFKEPFGLEENTSANYLTFMERSLTSTFTPAEHVGMCFYTHTENKNFTFASGLFFEDVNQVRKERRDDHQGFDFVSRGTWNPIYKAGGRGVLHLGAGYILTDDRDGFRTFSTRPEVHEGNYHLNTGSFAVDTMHRANLELAAVYGSFCLQSEVFYTNCQAPVGSPDQDLYGAYVFGSWFLTGEHRPYSRTSAKFGRVKPNTNFWIVGTGDGISRGCGAWELAARWSYLQLNDPLDVSPLSGQMNDATLGVNWYWNPNMRMMFNYIHSWGSVNTIPGLVANTDSLGMRMQVDF